LLGPRSIVLPLLLGGILSSAARSGELGEMRLYECMRTAAPPKLDGRLDDACWRAARSSSDFVRVLRDTDKPPSVQTHIRLLYDEKYLYVAVQCDEPHPENLKATILEDDNASVCGDDCIEMFFHPNPQSPDYCQLVASSRAVRYDGRRLDASWNADWQAATHIGKTAWTLECRIALASFPDRGSIWRFNVCRELRSTDPIEFHCWSDTYGAFHTPSRFGHLILAGPLGNLRRGHLIETAHYARATLVKQGKLERQAREIRQMRAKVPAKVLAPFAKQLARFDREEAACFAKFGALGKPSLSDWQALDAALGRLLAQREAIFWKLKFHVLLND
jgi:hypothetical protein